MEVQFRPVKIVAQIFLRPRMRGQIHFDGVARRIVAVREARPAVGIPAEFLEARLAAQRRGFVFLAVKHQPASALQRTMAKMHREPFAVLRFHKTAVAGGFQVEMIFLKRGQHRILRMQFVRPEQIFAATNADGVAHRRAALGGDEIIPAVLFQKVRAFGDADGAAGPDFFRLADQLHFLRVEFLQNNSVEANLVNASPICICTMYFLPSSS